MDIEGRKALESAREDLDEVRKAVFGDIGDEPDIFADYDKASEMSGKMRRALAAIDAALASGEKGSATHRHKMRGSEYVLLGIGKMQSENWYEFDGHPARPKVDMREVAIYRGTDGALWVRPREEFEDGRFQALIPAPSVAEAAEPVTRPSVLTIVSEALSDATDVLKAVHDWQAGSEILPIDLWTQVRDFLRKAGRI